MLSSPVGNFNKVLASTIQDYVDQMGMQVYNSSPFLSRLLGKDLKKELLGEYVSGSLDLLADHDHLLIDLVGNKD